MNEAERGRLAETRRLVFTNLVNGAPMENVGRAFRLSEREVVAHFDFVSRCIREYRLKRAMLHVPCQTLAEAKVNKLVVLETLKFIGPVALTSDHKLSNIITMTVNEAVNNGALEQIEARQAGR